MSVQTFEVNARPVTESITVTPAAVAHFRKQLTKKQKGGVRLSLKQSGCTGYMYVIEEVDGPQLGDAVKLLDQGVLLYIDPVHSTGLRGLEIDYRQQGLNQNLVMNNPNVKDACGCGESFSFE